MQYQNKKGKHIFKNTTSPRIKIKHPIPKSRTGAVTLYYQRAIFPCTGTLCFLAARARRATGTHINHAHISKQQKREVVMVAIDDGCKPSIKQPLTATSVTADLPQAHPLVVLLDGDVSFFVFVAYCLMSRRFPE